MDKELCYLDCMWPNIHPTPRSIPVARMKILTKRHTSPQRRGVGSLGEGRSYRETQALVSINCDPKDVIVHYSNMYINCNIIQGFLLQISQFVQLILKLIMNGTKSSKGSYAENQRKGGKGVVMMTLKRRMSVKPKNLKALLKHVKKLQKSLIF